MSYIHHCKTQHFYLQEIMWTVWCQSNHSAHWLWARSGRLTADCCSKWTLQREAGCPRRPLVWGRSPPLPDPPRCHQSYWCRRHCSVQALQGQPLHRAWKDGRLTMIQDKQGHHRSLWTISPCLLKAQSIWEDTPKIIGELNWNWIQGQTLEKTSI